VTATDEQRVAETADSGSEAAPESAAPIRRLTRNERRVRLVARLMVGVQVAVVSWAVFRGFFYFNDDFVFRGQGARYGWFDPAYVFQDWQGHFMPASFALSQPISKLGDFSYTWVALSLAGGQAFTAWMLMRTLLRNFGYRWRVLLALGLYLTSASLVQAATWWAAGMSIVPLLACLVIVSDRVLRSRGRRSASMLWWVLGVYAAALLFSERAVLLPLWVFLLLVAMTPGSLIASLVSVVRTHLAMLGGLLAITTAWAATYLNVHQAGPQPRPSLADLADQAGGVLTQQFLPALVGGGWSWFRITDQTYDFATASPLVIAFGAVLAVASLVLLFPSGPRARRALAAIVTYGFASMVLLSVGRPFFLYVAQASTLPRYFADLAPLTAIAAALAFARLVDDPAPGMLREWRPRVRARIVVPVLVVGQVIVLLWLSTVMGLVALTSSSFDRSWVQASLRSLHGAAGTSPVLNVLVPTSVMNPLLYPHNDYSWFFAGLSNAPAIGDVTDHQRVLDDTGALVDAHIEGPVAVSGTDPDCGWKVAADGTWIPMKSEIIPWAHVVQVAYISTGSSTLEVRFPEGDVRRVRLTPGLHDVYFWLNGGGGAIRLRTDSPQANVCVGAVRVGVVTPGAQPAAQS